MAKKMFQIPDMHCSSCVMRLEAIEDELPGVRQVKASYHKQQMEVDFDENLVSQEQIMAAIAQKGYGAILL